MNDPNLCPVHGLPWALVPAGVSKKTGRAYAQFRACQIKGCEMKPQAVTPTAAAKDPVPVSVMGGELYVGNVPQGLQQPRTAPQATPTDWAAKDRLIFAQSAYKSACTLYSGTYGQGQPDTRLNLSLRTRHLAEAAAVRAFMAFMEVQAGRPFRFPRGEAPFQDPEPGTEPGTDVPF